MKKFYYIVLVLLVGGILSAQDFELHGYSRAGYGLNEHGLNATTFQSEGAPAKYRLGNELDMFAATDFSMNWSNYDGTWFKTVSSIVGHPGDFDVNFDQVYFEGGNFDWLPDGSVWGGKRNYNRFEMVLNDFLLRDESGFGIGIDNLEVIIGKLSIAYLIGYDEYHEGFYLDKDGYQVISQAPAHNLSLRLHRLVVPGGDLEIQVTPSFANAADGSGRLGIHGSLYYHLSSFFGLPGWGKVAAQYGYGLGSQFKQNNTGGTATSSKIRGAIFGLLEVNETYPVYVQALYQLEDDYDVSDDLVHWISAGLRPEYVLTDNIKILAEYGFDLTINEAGDKGMLNKITLAPTLSMGRGWFVRPELRTFATYSFFSEELNTDKDNAFSFGFQFEVWY